MTKTKLRRLILLYLIVECDKRYKMTDNSIVSDLLYFNEKKFLTINSAFEFIPSGKAYEFFHPILESMSLINDLSIFEYTDMEDMDDIFFIDENNYDLEDEEDLNAFDVDSEEADDIRFEVFQYLSQLDMIFVIILIYMHDLEFKNIEIDSIDKKVDEIYEKHDEILSTSINFVDTKKIYELGMKYLDENEEDENEEDDDLENDSEENNDDEEYPFNDIDKYSFDFKEEIDEEKTFNSLINLWCEIGEEGQ